MAAPSNNFIRVRLEFDYPPPALVDCRMCWLLVDLNTCRVVADLESIIREKFEFSRRSILNLFIESCYLPHTESIYVVRDNDSVRVKLEYLDLVNGDSRVPEKANESTRKRRRHAEEHQKEENKAGVERKKKRRVEKQDVKQASVHEKEKKLQGKCKEKKKKKKSEKKVKSAASTKNSPVKVDQPLKPKKPPVAQRVSSSSSSSSEEQEAPQKPAPNSPFSAPTSSCKQSQPKQRLPSSSSSESSSDEANTNKSASQPTPQHTHTPTNDALTSQLTPPVKPLSNCAQNQTSSTLEQPSKSSVSGSEEEIEFVIRKPVQPPGFGMGGPSYLGGFGRRGKNGRDGSAQRGRGGNRGGFRGQTGSFERDNNGVDHPSYQTDSLSNASVVLQNKTENTPKDYGSMPLLAAPPQVGQRIAFKLLELTENYTPEVSDYKEGKMISFDHTTTQIELELQAVSQVPVEPGKFDLVYQNPDGTERVEYAVSRDARVVERWDCLLEPRLII